VIRLHSATSPHPAGGWNPTIPARCQHPRAAQMAFLLSSAVAHRLLLGQAKVAIQGCHRRGKRQHQGESGHCAMPLNHLAGGFAHWQTRGFPATGAANQLEGPPPPTNEGRPLKAAIPRAAGPTRFADQRAKRSIKPGSRCSSGIIPKLNGGPAGRWGQADVIAERRFTEVVGGGPGGLKSATSFGSDRRQKNCCLR